MGHIRRLSVGPDYKNGMNFLVGQKIFNDKYEIHELLIDSVTSSYQVWIEDLNTKEILLWKRFNQSMPVAIEYNIDFL